MIIMINKMNFEYDGNGIQNFESKDKFSTFKILTLNDKKFQIMASYTTDSLPDFIFEGVAQCDSWIDAYNKCLYLHKSTNFKKKP